MHSIVVVYFRLPGWITVARPTVADVVTAFEEDPVTRPIANPVSSIL